MSYKQRISAPLSGVRSNLNKIGWIGDSITACTYLTVNPAKYRFSSVVSAFLGASEYNIARNGRVLASFLPYKTGPVASANADFDGQFLKDDDQWYWYDDEWKAVPSTGVATSLNGTDSAAFQALLDDESCKVVFITHTATNDVTAASDSGMSGAHKDRHYGMLLNELITRCEAAKKTVLVFTGATATGESFHGKPTLFMQQRLGVYSEKARQVCAEKNISVYDLGLRLNIEIALGREDILTRNANVKPSSKSQSDWDLYLASVGDPDGSNPYRVIDESEDYLHYDDVHRSSFWYNQHPNIFGHYIIANEIIKCIKEFGVK